jgi:hypothetical protein
MKRWQVHFVVTSVLAVFSAPSVVATTIEEWVSQNTNGADKILCKREIRHEYIFFSQSASGRVKLGTRLDMTGYRETHTFLVGWIFQDEQNQSLSTKIPPTLVTTKYVKSGDRVFAENVEYQTLRSSGGGKVRVGLKVKKCPTSECDLQQKRNKEEQEYMIDLCEIAISE